MKEKIDLRDLYNNINDSEFKGKLPDDIRIKVDRRVSKTCLKFKTRDIRNESFNRIRLLVSEDDYCNSRKHLISEVKSKCSEIEDLIDNGNPLEITRTKNEDIGNGQFKVRICPRLGRSVKCNGLCSKCERTFSALKRMVN